MASKCNMKIPSEFDENKIENKTEKRSSIMDTLY